jgi:hypothetical protein
MISFAETNPMPGPTRPQPERPRRIWTFSPDRLRLATFGFFMVPMGLLFSSVGLFSMFQILRVWLARSGIELPLPYPPPAARLPMPTEELAWRTLMNIVLMSLFVIVGLRMMYVVSVMIDRACGIVVVRSGCLGLWSKHRKLAGFDRIKIRQGEYFSRVTAPFFDRSKDYDIVLAGAEPPEMPIALVTMSHDLAMEVANEVRQFTRLKIEDLTTPTREQT